jgi:hypothetical protein
MNTPQTRDTDRSPAPVRLVACAVVLACTHALAGDLRAPGFTWGEIRYPSSEQALERDDLVLEGAVDQGLDVLELSEKDRLNIFARLRYKADTEELDFNNKVVLAGGARLLHQLSDSAVIGAGVLYEFDRRFRSNRNLDGVTAYVDGYGSWQLRCTSCAESSVLAGRAMPGLIWAELRYPASHDPLENDDLLIEGVVEQGIDWMRVGDRGALNTFASLEFQADTEGLDYYRSISGGLGVKLKFPFGRTGLLQIGAEYVVDHRWESDVTQDVVMGFINWSTSWDARTIRRDLPE